MKQAVFSSFILPPSFLHLVVGVGIEPTSRIFQTRANPSQLSDPRHCRLPIFNFRLVGQRALSFSRQLAFDNWQCPLGPPPLLVMHLFHDGPIVVHVHEEVLAPLGSTFCIVTKHDAFELHAQRRLRSQQRHSCFRRCAVALAVVACDASRHDVHRRVIPTARTRHDVIER